MTARNLEAECRHRATKAAQLRAILADNRFHDGRELAARVGHRFGGYLHVLRRGEDGYPPCEIVSLRLTEDGSRWKYRLVGELPYPPLKRARHRPRYVAELEREVERLRRELAQVRGGA